jgi:hypothetical protein
MSQTFKRRPQEYSREEIEKLVKDYNKDNAYIRRQKYKWLDPKPRIKNEQPTQTQVTKVPAEEE